MFNSIGWFGWSCYRMWRGEVGELWAVEEWMAYLEGKGRRVTARDDGVEAGGGEADGFWVEGTLGGLVVTGFGRGH